jgi:hypothetical protein
MIAKSNSRTIQPDCEVNPRRQKPRQSCLSTISRTVAFCMMTVVLYTSSFALARADAVIPRSMAAVEGNTSESAAGMSGSSAYTNQIQIAASELSALGVQIGDQITGLRQRLDSTQLTGPAAADGISDFEITLAEAANPISAMSTLYVANMIDPMMVRDGPFTLPANSMPGGGAPNAFGAVVGFDTPYTYQGGDLIIMLSRTATPSPLTIDSSANYTGIGTLYRILINGTTFHASTGLLQGAMGIFQLQISAVPEPTSLGMSIVAATLFARRFRRTNRSTKCCC